MRGEPILCVTCRDWPLVPREGNTAPPGQRTCDLLRQHRAWDSRSCPVYSEDRADKRRREAFIDKHSKGANIAESSTMERAADA